MKKFKSVAKWIYLPNIFVTSLTIVFLIIAYYFRITILLYALIVGHVAIRLKHLREIRKVVDFLIEEKRQWRKLATYDYLTGALNRGIFMDDLIKEVERAIRYKHKLSFIILDLDHFKSINDTYGHAIGDNTLKSVCTKIRSVIRAGDYLGRLGGEEFGIILPETSANDAATLMERIRTHIENTSDEVDVTVSSGVTELKADDNIDTLYERADVGLYESKNKGRNMTTVK